MAYFCKKCLTPVCVTQLHGVLEIAVDRGHKPTPSNKCPICGNPFNSREDLKYVQQKEEKP